MVLRGRNAETAGVSGMTTVAAAAAIFARCVASAGALSACWVVAVATA